MIPLERYAGRVFASGAYGRPALAWSRRSRPLLLLLAFVALVGVLWAIGALDSPGGAFLAAGPVVTERSKEHRRAWAKALADARTISDAAPADGTLGAEDQTRFDALMKSALDHRSAAESEEKLAGEERDASAPLDPPTLPIPDGGNRSDDDELDEPISAERRARQTPEYRKAYRSWLRGDQGAMTRVARALQMDSDTAGGYTVAPEQFMTTLIKAVDNVVHIRARATTYQVENAASLGFPSLSADPDDFDWTTELGTGNEDSAMAFGKREFRPQPLAKRIKISKKLLRASTMDPEGLVIDRLAYKVGVTQEKAFLTGTGANQPLGVFVASADGVPTSRDTTASSTSAFTADDLQDTKYALKPQYRGSPNTAWLFHRDGVKRAAKLKDGNGRYLLEPGLSADIPDRILGLPFLESEYSPNTFTTGLYVAMLADWSWYWIADALDMQVQRLVELYAESNQDGFIARYEGDGMPVQPEAFSRLKLA
jgi:HK97 family phage major capsid protein